MSEDRSSTDLVTVETASDSATAELIAGILRSAGIPVYIAGALLQDQWAMARKLAGLLAVEVQVPRAYLEEARRMLAEAREGAAQLEEESEEEAPIETGEPGKPSEAQNPSITERMLWAEAFVVFLVALAPLICQSVGSLIWPQPPVEPISVEASVWALTWDVPLIALLIYLMVRSGESWSVFGITQYRYFWDSLFGFILFVVDFILTELVRRIIKSLVGSEFSIHSEEARVATGSVSASLPVCILASVSICISAFQQEIVVRGYLIPRLERLLKSTWGSVFLTAFLFGACHVGQGVSGTVGATLSGFVYGAAFCVTRRLWPIVLAHSTYNLVAYFG